MRNKLTLCTAVCAAAIVSVPLAAKAQSTDANAAAPAQAQDDARVQEIVVTAQRRSENLQSVPISVTAANADQLLRAGVQSTSDLSLVAPAVHVSTGLGGAVVSIRGVGGTGSGADEPANAVYIDGVYQSSPTASLFSFNNIERIEVLKGPQGTLFGRNAAGGLVQVITRAPQFNPMASAEVGFGSYETGQANVYATGPISQSVAIDFAGTIQHQWQGWGKNTLTGQDAYKGETAGARSKLLWNIDSATSLTLIGLYSHTYSPSLQGGGLLPGELTVTGFKQGNYYDVNRNVDDKAGTDQVNFAATLKHDFGHATFTSITSHDNVKFLVDKDLDMSPVPVLELSINSKAKTWTQEFQLASDSKVPFSWVLGAFYYHNDLLTDPLRASGLAVLPLQYADTFSEAVTDSYALYGQATYQVAAHTRLTGGLRYTIDKRHIDFTTSVSDPTIPPQVFPRQSVSNRKLTWRVALDQQFTPDVLGYASYSRGFKSGLFNATNPGLPPVAPETVDAYEIGLKTELFDRHLRANISVFDNEVSDIQLRGVPNGLNTPIFYNAANASLRGADVELEAAPIEHLHVQANASYLTGKYGPGFTNALFYTVPPAPAGGLVGGIGDASGNRPVLTPEWVASLSAQYIVPTAIGDLEFAGSYSYNGSFFFDPQNRVQQPAYSLVGASVAWRPMPDLEIRFWGSNLTDARHYTDVEPSNFGDQYYPAAPRTFGGTIKWSFGKARR